MQLFCRIRNGLIPSGVIESLQASANKAGEGDYIIEIKKKTRSNAQNKYYWGVVIPIVMDALNKHIESDLKADKNDVHLFIMERIGRVHKIKTKEGDLILKRGLSKTKTDECEDVFTQIRAYFAERGIDIPEPNEDKFYKGDY